MAAGNFWTMDDFPLVVFKTDYEGTDEEALQEYLDDSPEALDLEELGQEELLERARAFCQEDAEFWAEELYRDLARAAKWINYDLNFYRVDVESGYYSGLQFYVSELPERKVRHVYGAALNAMIGKEQRKITAWMLQQAREHGGYTAGVAYRFSNGETGYTLQGVV